MKKAIYFISSIFIFSCNIDRKTISESKIKQKENISSIKEDSTIKYVTAKSGLNYRKTPKGEIIGKFNYGDKIKIIEYSNVFESIKDGKKMVKGQWLGVKINDNIVYVFEGYLKNKKEFISFNNNLSNLIPSDYEIEYEAKGDLNGDKIDDAVVVIKRKNEFRGERDVLVFIRDNNIFKLSKISKTVFPNKFLSEDQDTKVYYQEDIVIKNNELKIKLFGTGPAPNNYYTFKFFGQNFILTNIETYSMGAGSHHQFNYDVLNGKLTEEVTNTLKENTLTTTHTFKVKRKEYYFESCYPEKIIYDVSRSI